MEQKPQKPQKKAISLGVDPVTLKKLKIIAVLKDTDLKGLLREAVEKILQENQEKLSGLKFE